MRRVFCITARHCQNLIFKECELPESDDLVKKQQPSDVSNKDENSDVKTTSRNTPRIHDVAKENLKEDDKENKRHEQDDVFLEEKEVRKKKEADEKIEDKETKEEKDDEVHLEHCCLIPCACCSVSDEPHTSAAPFMCNTLWLGWVRSTIAI